MCERIQLLLPFGNLQLLDSLFLGQTRQAFGRGLKTQAQGPLNAGFPIAEGGRIENFGELATARAAVQHLGINAHDLMAGGLWDFPALTTEALAHGLPKAL